jgi:uncharacterized zinc-type alcohol dehydrogenase-like protein
MIMVGVPPAKFNFNLGSLVMGRKVLAGSLIGGIKETQEMLDFCGKHDIVCDIELITPDQIDDAYVRVHDGTVKYRAVIDMTAV